ncbi:MAG: formate dehydrogenase subunit alpha [Planctomycetaceae bacterium]|nr:formate dehydrogenase subunit alpha [Planctomycetaceae bacterium]MBP62254.1 formate dehydrogenase subunit alpha [Planctomycetaceae bacterium]
MSERIQLTIDGLTVEVPAGTSLWEAARSLGIDIPTLCHTRKLDPVGVCRMCVVDVGERVLAASCTRECQPGMQVTTHSEAIQKHRQTLTALLLADHQVPCAREQTTADCELEQLGRDYGLLGGQETKTATPLSPASKWLLQNSGFDDPRRKQNDTTSAVISVDHQSCILCDRCIRACDDIQSNDVIGRSGKGYTAQIAFDLNNPMGHSTCVSCGECVSTCPTGALTNKPITLPLLPPDDLHSVDTVCPYCGVGCAVTFHAKDNHVVYTEGRDSPVNRGRLCVKGRYGFDYSSHEQRLTRPLIRRDEYYPKGPLSEDVGQSIPKSKRRAGGVVDYAEIMPAFREASWEEALDMIARRFRDIRETFGGSSLAGFGSAKCSNEEAYLFQKLIRAGFGTNNVDHCTRLCHASSVAALMETIGSGAVTNIFSDVEHADVALVTGSNTTANHPVAATFMKEAAKQNTKLIIVDVRRHELADFAEHFAQIKPGTDVAFYNGVMHVLIHENLVDQKFIAERTEGFESLCKLVLDDYSPRQVSAVCGVPTDQIVAIARTIGRARAMLVFWGMGISQHTTGTDNARCLISLCLLTGNIGRPGTGLHPLRGQNNVQGASDAGLIPMVFPDYQPVTTEANRQKFEQAWQTTLDSKPGLTVVEIIKAALERSIRGMYILGENPFISDPNANKVRSALSSLDFLVVQDIFLTETAEFADVILPASSYFEKTGTYTNTDRRVQLGRPILELPGNARQDWEIICDLGRRLGLKMNYSAVNEVFDEFTCLTKNYRGLAHNNLGSTGKLWPCPDPANSDGTQILFTDSFPTDSGKGLLVPCHHRGAEEQPDDEFPYILSTGRLLEHWHTGNMTRRSQALSQIQPHAFAAMNPADLKDLGLNHGDRVRVSSRRGEIELAIRADHSLEQGVLFIPFHFREAAANFLTNDTLDPYGKIPGYKFCAVQVQRA